jgi:DUF1680 family protein
MYEKIDLKNISITGGFWREKQKLVAGTTVPYIWKALNDNLPGATKSGAIENFRIASGKSKAKFYGLVSQDSDLFKWMEAAAYSLYVFPSRETEANLDEMIKLVGTAQQPDGYLNTYGIINGAESRWSYLKESCQLYCAGHLIEAAVAHFQVTRKHDLLDIACRYSDCIDNDFGPGETQIHGYDGHAEVELALFRLYEVTGEERYRRLAEYFVEERGKQPYFFEIERKNEKVHGNLYWHIQ